ncbi:MAG: hypothetical protein LBE35_07355 [Clostridiales bacterium]|jgi:hypothetical protein|nr:hypothetical protein [Clostridiales bacterium]
MGGLGIEKGGYGYTTRISMRHQSTEFAIYELVKVETAIVPITIMRTMHDWNHDRLEATDEAMFVIESLIEAQTALFELAKTIIGKPYESARTLILNFPANISNKEELASMFRDW